MGFIDTTLTINELDNLLSALDDCENNNYDHVSLIATKASGVLTGYSVTSDLVSALDEIAENCVGPIEPYAPNYLQKTINTIVKAKLLLKKQSEGLLKPPNTPQSDSSMKIGRSTNKVFIVHGHDPVMKKAVADFISQLGLEPIVLHKQPNKGRTIIEKFEEHANVGFAVGLFSPDDFTRKPRARKTSEKRCPRQNVILQTGFFIGQLGREKVALLVKDREKLEYPSDYDGVLYITYSETGNWQTELANELKHAGYRIDLSNLLTKD